MSSEAGRILDAYYKRLISDDAVRWGTKSGESRLRRITKLAIGSPDTRFRLRRLATLLLKPRERVRARRIAQHHPLRLHLGGAASQKEGWVNIDLAGYPVEIAWDLARPLPFERNSVDAVFHEALLRFFTLPQARAFMDECYRVLRPGGVIRVAVSDVRAYARSYLDDPEGFLESVRPGRPTPLIALQEMIYISGTRTLYDFETLSLLLRASGFVDVTLSEFGQSRIQPPPDSEHRRLEMFYTEGVKPLASDVPL